MKRWLSRPTEVPTGIYLALVLMALTGDSHSDFAWFVRGSSYLLLILTLAALAADHIDNKRRPR